MVLDVMSLQKLSTNEAWILGTKKVSQTQFFENKGPHMRGSWNSQYCWTRETCPFKNRAPWATTQVYIRCIWCSGCIEQLKHRSSPSGSCTLVYLSPEDSQYNLQRCPLDAWVMQSLFCGNLSLWARSKSLLAAEHPFLYLKSKDSIAVRFVTRTGVLFIDSRALGWR